MRNMKQIKTNRYGDRLTVIYQDYVSLFSLLFSKTLKVCDMDLTQTTNCYKTQKAHDKAMFFTRI